MIVQYNAVGEREPEGKESEVEGDEVDRLAASIGLLMSHDFASPTFRQDFISEFTE